MPLLLCLQIEINNQKENAELRMLVRLEEKCRCNNMRKYVYTTKTPVSRFTAGSSPLIVVK